ncbi:hypothetical protein BGZ76_010040 [Entomortierella beljakovae]|nr:hypothetical protein BGZ76_010040 [Entomortierella beljakovae]
MPISTLTTTNNSRESHPAQSFPEIATANIHMNKTSPSLPSPPLSPHQFNQSEHGRSASLPMLPLIATTPSLSPHNNNNDDDDDDDDNTDDTGLLSPSVDTPSTSSQPLDSFGPLDKPKSNNHSVSPLSSQTPTSFSSGIPFEEEIDETVPMLPSQLRRRHESMKLLAKQQQPINRIDQIISDDQSTTPIIDLSSKELKEDESDTDDVEVINASYHSGTMVRVKSHSMFESSNHGSNSNHQWDNRHQMDYMSGLAPPTLSTHHHQEMPTKDWVMMQSKMQALELEISHVKRTNLLLNQELDKVNTHMARITSNGNEIQEGQVAGWRREYEFLVQQLDWMHQQLQIARADRQGRPQYQEMTQELCTEVNGLATSLRMWQSAFQQAEEKYRRKCDDERVLKQNLKERDAQLSSLVEKLTGYENQFQKSVSNYEELLRLSAELNTVDQSVQGNTSSYKDAIEMPGNFPGLTQEREINSVGFDKNVTPGQLIVPILSWATLLVTYILS